MGREPLTREEYDEAVDAYIDEYKSGRLHEITFQARLRKIGMDDAEIDYLVRTTVT